MAYESPVDGVPSSAFSECPECGSEVLEGVAITIEEMQLTVEGGGIKHYEPDVHLETLFQRVACSECDTVLVSDGELADERLTD